ncbi:MAG: hypothetical protein OXE94_09725 [Aestuariivita sp.]|nr:hypothetical protein [Aestuariivita sp.]MCY4203895.1 hypothetical protein [Aestuariivita sp.]
MIITIVIALSEAAVWTVYDWNERGKIPAIIPRGKNSGGLKSH